MPHQVERAFARPDTEERGVLQAPSLVAQAEGDFVGSQKRRVAVRADAAVEPEARVRNPGFFSGIARPLQVGVFIYWKDGWHDGGRHHHLAQQPVVETLLIQLDEARLVGVDISSGDDHVEVGTLAVQLADRYPTEILIEQLDQALGRVLVTDEKLERGKRPPCLRENLLAEPDVEIVDLLRR